MKRTINIVVLLALLLSFTGAGVQARLQNARAAAATPATYTVMVGAEDTRYKAEINTFFPDTLQVHPGDTVVWKANSMDFHTVTFNAPNPLPAFVIPVSGQASPVQINPLAGLPTPPLQSGFDGTGFVNSGLIGLEPEQTQTFSMTFTTAGDFSYVCLVHGNIMTGTINVVDPATDIPSPELVQAQANTLIDQALSKVPQAYNTDRPKGQHPTRNADGTLTFHVQVGFSSGNINFHAFAPERLFVHQGDQVQWALGDTNMAPHTVTFMNGASDVQNVTPVPNPPGPPILLINPKVALPSNLGQPLTRNGYYNSGFLAPGLPNTTYALTVGDITGRIGYVCLLHDDMGMFGELVVFPGHSNVSDAEAQQMPAGGNGSLNFLPIVSR